MENMRKPRRAFLRLEYDGRVIDVDKEIVSFSYTDNADKADEIAITLFDGSGTWRGPWWPQPRVSAETISQGEPVSAGFEADDYEDL